jgi:hypothetical protein
MGGVGKADKATARPLLEHTKQSAESGSTKQKQLKSNKNGKKAAVEQVTEECKGGRTPSSHHSALLAGAQLLCGMMKGMLGKPVVGVEQSCAAKTRSEQKDVKVRLLFVCMYTCSRVCVRYAGQNSAMYGRMVCLYACIHVHVYVYGMLVKTAPCMEKWCAAKTISRNRLACS